jgi:hypothetical protein
MNNAAFQKVVRDGGGSSTKAIARAAVEEEFKKHRKGKKRRHDDDLSDSDDAGDRKPKKQELLFRPSQLKKTQKEVEEGGKYRDRAKERREGGAFHSIKPSDDPKASLPEVVKGLDLSLVRKERAQLKRQGDDGDSVSSVDNKGVAPGIPSFEQAQDALEKFVQNPDLSLPAELSEFVIQFACSKFSIPDRMKRVTVRADGRTLQQTRLVLRPHTHISHKARAWEAPKELIQASATDLRHVPPLAETVLAFVKRLFPDISSTTDNASTAGSPKKESSESGERDGQPVSKTRSLVVTAEDDNDDIFGGLDDYVPPQSS